MTGFRSTLMAAVLILGFAGSVWYFEIEKGEQKKEQKEKDATLIRLPQDQITKIELKKVGSAIVLEKKDETWRLTEPIQDLADVSAVNALLGTATHEKSLEIVAPVSEVDLKIYGLENPSEFITLQTADGKIAELQIGSVQSYDGNLYLRRKDGPEVLLAGSALQTLTGQSPNDLRDKRLYRDTSHAPERIELRIGGGFGGAIAAGFSLYKEQGRWNLKDSPSRIPVSQDAVDSFLAQVQSLRGIQFLGQDEPDAKSLKEYNLHQPWITLEVSRPEIGLWKLQVGGPKGKDDANVFATSSAVPGVVEIYKSAVDGWLKGRDQFLDRKAPVRFNLADVNEVEVTDPRLAAVFKKDGENWKLASAPEGQEADTEKVKDLLNRLSGLEVEAFHPLSKAKGLGDQRRIQLRNAQGESVLDLRWGETYSDKSVTGAETYRYIRTDKFEDEAFALKASAVDGLPLKELIKSKPAVPAAALVTEPVTSMEETSTAKSSSAPSAPKN